MTQPPPEGRRLHTGWQASTAPRGNDYDARWDSLAASGHNVHGEADLVEQLLSEAGATRVLDAGCGTGRVAIELSRRGFDVTGVDSDPAMLSAARHKHPELRWIEADLAQHSDAESYDLVLLAGNVMIFLDPGTEGQVLTKLTRCLTPHGLLVAGFQLTRRRLQLSTYDQLASTAGLSLERRWSTWDCQPFTGGTYAVSVHCRV